MMECVLFTLLTPFGLCINLDTHSKDEQDGTGIVFLAKVAELLGLKCGPLCSSIFPIFSGQHSDSWNLDTKFCLHAAGGIYVEGNFEHLEGKIQISGSSAEHDGGAVRV